MDGLSKLILEVDIQHNSLMSRINGNRKGENENEQLERRLKRLIFKLIHCTVLAKCSSKLIYFSLAIFNTTEVSGGNEGDKLSHNKKEAV